MKNYIILNLETQEMFRSEDGSVKLFNDYNVALAYCGIYELENVWVCELIKYIGTDIAEE